MSNNHFPVGLQIDIDFPEFHVSHNFLSDTRLTFEIKEGPFARTETVDINVISLGNSIFAISWQERDGATVTNIQDYDRNLVHSFATLPNGQFLRMSGTLTVTQASKYVSDDRPHRNRALVLEAMTSLFQRHDKSAVERLYVPGYVQHNPNIPQGRDALASIVADLPKDVYYEPGLVIAEKNFVAIHGRIRGWADRPQVVVDLFRIEGGMLAEHWDVLQDEAPLSTAFGGMSMLDPEEGRLQDDTAG
jgi:predicted SnoaL-like aldol condensation-catalyzing enzyme